MLNVAKDNITHEVCSSKFFHELVIVYLFILFSLHQGKKCYCLPICREVEF